MRVTLKVRVRYILAMIKGSPRSDSDAAEREAMKEAGFLGDDDDDEEENVKQPKKKKKGKKESTVITSSMFTRWRADLLESEMVR